MAVRRNNTRSERIESLDPYTSSTKKKNTGLCYAFKEGNCQKGDNCPFRHDQKEKDLDEDGNEIIYLETPRLYVSNLAWNVTWQDLKGLFRQEGSVLRVEVMSHPDGRSKGCAIVEYNDINDAAQALTTLNGVELRGRAIYVREDREEKGTNGSGGGNAKKSSQKNQSRQVMSTPDTAPEPVSSNEDEEIIYLNAPRLYVNNLGWNVTWQDLKGLFRKEGRVVRAQVMTNQDGRSKGCGIVEYSDINAAARALTSLNGVELRGRAIYVREDRDVVGGRLKREGMGSTEEGGIVVLKAPRLFVNNLPYDVSWQEVKDYFRKCGEVRRCNVMTGAGGRPLGCAIVEFVDIEDAARAVRALHNVEFHGRSLHVREDRESKNASK